MTHKKKRTTKKKSKSVTKKLQKNTSALVDLTHTEVHKFNYKQIQEAVNIYNSQRLLWMITDLIAAMNKGYSLGTYEIEAFEELVERFNQLYKSPLANALKE